mmetsp:Transcript_10485/g.11767  ORF Transcript_10485/g.11767 Transcript_10485/m.11767 type:complete len:128 (-) Transcript_10485:57-440(-)
MSEVISATSFDLRFSADNIFDSDPSTFWITTGLYPQELMIDLKAPHNLNELKVKSMRVKKMLIEGCASAESSETNFFKIGEKNFKGTGDSMQNEKISLTGAKGLLFLRVVIEEGYDDFASVHYVEMV